MRVLVGVNTLTTLNQYVYANHCQMWYRLGKEYPETQFFFFSPPRMSIDRMRNTAAKVALEQECDYLMFVDDDVLVPFRGFNRLIEANYDILAGIAVIRGYPYNLMAFKFDDKMNLVHFNTFEKEDPTKRVLDVDAVGFSCVLIKTKLLKEIRTPYFVSSVNSTEDIYFCMKAIDQFKRENLKIGIHRDVICGHLGDAKVYMPSNIEYHKALDEFENPAIVEMDNTAEATEMRKRAADRGEEYIKRLGIDKKLEKYAKT